MRRSFGLAALLVALSLAFPIGVSAGPVWARIPPGTLIADLPAGVICPASVGEVTWTYLDGTTAFVEKPGRGVLSAGNARWEIKSLLTGKSVVLATAGSGLTSEPAEDGSFVVKTAGTVMWGFFPGDAGPGDRATARTYLMVGRTTALLAADSTGLEFSYSGQILMDVCAAISS